MSLISCLLQNILRVYSMDKSMTSPKSVWLPQPIAPQFPAALHYYVLLRRLMDRLSVLRARSAAAEASPAGAAAATVAWGGTDWLTDCCRCGASTAALQVSPGGIRRRIEVARTRVCLVPPGGRGTLFACGVAGLRINKLSTQQNQKSFQIVCKLLLNKN